MNKLLLLAALSATLTLSAETPAPAKAEQSKTPAIADAKKAPKPNADGTMQIEITLGELVGARLSLNKLGDMDLPVKISLGLSKTRKAVNVELEACEEQRLKLVKKYTTKPGESVPPEKMAEFTPEYNALMAISVKLTITPVSLAALGESVKLSANDMARLEPFLIP